MYQGIKEKIKDADRYYLLLDEVQGKSVLKTQEKFYLADASLKYCIMGFNPQSIAAMLEIKDHYPKYVVTLDELAACSVFSQSRRR